MASNETLFLYCVCWKHACLDMDECPEEERLYKLVAGNLSF